MIRENIFFINKLKNVVFLGEHDSLEQFIKIMPSICLYAELHYKFPYFGSKYYKKEPEIISDTPFRIEPEKEIPILILIKDCHLFPIFIQNIIISIYKSEKLIKSITKDYSKIIKTRWWENIIFIEPLNCSSYIDINVEIN